MAKIWLWQVVMVCNVMEIISISHQCLLFRYNNRKYLLGLTATLAQDSATARIKIDYIILPSLPFDTPQSLFLWHLPALNVVNCQNIVVSDSAVRKRLEGLLASLPEMEGRALKWEMMKQHELTEEHLWKIYEEFRSKNLPQPLRAEPHGLAFNDSPQKLNIVVPEFGKSLILLHQGKAMLVDPGQDIVGTLKYYGIPPTALSAVILTHANSLNIFELLLQPQPVTVITSEQVYSQLKKQLKAYFFWDDAMLRLKLRGNIMIEQAKWYRFGSLEFSFSEDKCSVMVNLDLMFGMKRVRVCPQRLLQYPSELVDLKDLELYVVYDMQDPIKKELECAPAAYRKRVLFNRPTRKFNNKYFLTLKDPSHFITITAHPYTQVAKQIFDLGFMHRQKDHNYRLQHRKLVNGEKFNVAERTVYLREGYLRDQNQKLYSAQITINGAKELRAEGNVSIMHEPARNVSFYSGAKLIDAPSLMTAEDLLKKVRENSFVKTLQRHCGQEQLILGEWEQKVECGSEWQALNSLASLRTLQAGSDAGKGNSLLLVVKGGLRWRSSETVAGRGMGVCNLRKFYSSAYEDGDEVEVVKDSWVIQIPLKDLHSRFFSKYPSRMYELFSKPPIFQ